VKEGRAELLCFPLDDDLEDGIVVVVMIVVFDGFVVVVMNLWLWLWLWLRLSPIAIFVASGDV